MKRIVVLGGGESGTGAAVLAKTKGFEVWLSDMGAIKDKYKALLNNYGIEWEEKQHNTLCRRGNQEPGHTRQSSYHAKDSLQKHPGDFGD